MGGPLTAQHGPGGIFWLGYWSCLITPAQPTGATPETPRDSHPVKRQEELSLLPCGKRAPRQVPDQAKLISELAVAFSQSPWIPAAVGAGGGRESCAHRHGEEEGEEENKGRERTKCQHLNWDTQRASS